MKKTFAFISIFLLLVSGIHAPEAQVASRGICWSGPTLEKVAPAPSQEWHKASSNPLLLHSGFAPAAHPFDFPEVPALSDTVISGAIIVHTASFLGIQALFPHGRPPINLVF